MVLWQFSLIFPFHFSRMCSISSPRRCSFNSENSSMFLRFQFGSCGQFFFCGFLGATSTGLWNVSLSLKGYQPWWNTIAVMNRWISEVHNDLKRRKHDCTVNDTDMSLCSSLTLLHGHVCVLCCISNKAPRVFEAGFPKCQLRIEQDERDWRCVIAKDQSTLLEWKVKTCRRCSLLSPGPFWIAVIPGWRRMGKNTQNPSGMIVETKDMPASQIFKRTEILSSSMYHSRNRHGKNSFVSNNLKAMRTHRKRS